LVETKKKYKAQKATVKKPKSKISLLIFILSVLLLVIVSVLKWDSLIQALPIGDTAIHKYLINSSDVRKCIPYKNLMVLCTKSSIVAIDKKGSEKWRINENIDNPIMAISNEYIAVSSKGGKFIYYITGDGKYEEFETESPIQNIKMGENGYIVTILDEKSYNGCVTVYNKKGVPLFKWSAGTVDLIDAAISPDGKKLAVSVIDTENMNINGNILLFNINSEEKQYAIKSYEDNLISSIRWANNSSIIAASDKQLFMVDSGGKEKWVYKFNDEVLNYFDISENNNLVLVTGGSSLDRHMKIKSLNLSGRVKGEYEYEGNIINISTTDSRILVSSMHECVIINKSGKRKAAFTSEKEVYNGYMYKNGGYVFLDEGGFAEVFLMK